MPVYRPLVRSQTRVRGEEGKFVTRSVRDLWHLSDGRLDRSGIWKWKINPVSFELLIQIDRGATEESLDVFFLNFWLLDLEIWSYPLPDRCAVCGICQMGDWTKMVRKWKINPVSFELLIQIDGGATEESFDVFFLNFWLSDLEIWSYPLPDRVAIWLRKIFFLKIFFS